MALINLLDFFVKKPLIRRWITALVERDRDLTIEVFGTPLFVNTRREHGYLRASRMCNYNVTLREEAAALMNLFAVIRPDDTFVDVGANVGLFTHTVSRLKNIYPNLSIVAIEASPTTFKRLTARQSPGVVFINKAMSDTVGTLSFVDGAVSHVFTRLDKKNKYNISSEITEVVAERLDEQQLPGKSLVLKVDVEGQESLVLRGAQKLFDEGRVRAVYLDGYDDLSIHDFFKDRGFTLLNGRTLEPVKGKVMWLLAIRNP